MSDTPISLQIGGLTDVGPDGHPIVATNRLARSKRLFVAVQWSCVPPHEVEDGHRYRSFGYVARVFQQLFTFKFIRMFPLQSYVRW